MRNRSGLTAIMIVIAALVWCSVGSAAASVEPTALKQEMKLTVDGKAAAGVPFRHSSGDIMVPLADFVSAIGGQLTDSGFVVKVAWDNLTVIMKKGSKQASVNGTPVPLQKAPGVYSKQVYAPLEAIRHLFGIESDYDPQSKEVQINTAPDRAVIFGYMVDESGNPIESGELLFRRMQEPGDDWSAEVVDGYYSLTLPKGEYTLKSLQVKGDSSALYTYDKAPMILKETDRLFMQPNVPKMNLTINVKYEDGKPVESGELTYFSSNGRNTVRVQDGVARMGVTKRQKLFFDVISLPATDGVKYDIYSKYDTEPANGSATAEITVYRPNVKLSITNPSGKKVSGSVSLWEKSGPNNASESLTASSSTSVVELYLPPGSYEWTSFTAENMNGYRAQQFQLSRSFTVTKGSDTALDWSLPVMNVTGTAKLKDGEILELGSISFFSKSGFFIYTAPVNDKGYFEISLPDGTYHQVVYYGLRGGASYRSETTESFTVSGGKIQRSSDFVF